MAQTSVLSNGEVLKSHQPQMVTSVSNGRFSNDLFDWYTEYGICLTACACPCVVYSDTMKTAYSKSSGLSDCCFYYVLMRPFYCFVGASGRSNIRELRKIDGDYCTDCLIHCCCTSCALTQERRESMLINQSRHRMDDNKMN